MSRHTSLLLLIALVCIACASDVDSVEKYASGSSAVVMGSGTIPFPVKTDEDLNPVLDPSGNPVAAWDGSLADLMAADAWALCVQNTSRSFLDDANENDEYLEYLMARIDVAACQPTLGWFPLPAATRWLQQRTNSACNVDTSTGLPTVVEFSEHETGKYQIKSSQVSIPGASAAIKEAVVSEAQKELEVAEVNLCMGQRLREYLSSADGLFLSGEARRELLSRIRQRVQLAVLQYALIGAAITSDHPVPTTLRDEGQTVAVLKSWSTKANPGSVIGADFAAAIKLYIETGYEFAELLARSASAGVATAEAPDDRAEQNWGADSWRRRLLELMYHGDPLRGITSDSFYYLEPEWDKYVREDARDPEVGVILGLARKADTVFLKAEPKLLDGGIESLETIDTARSARWIYRATEADLRNRKCQQSGAGGCNLAPDSSEIPEPATGFSDYLLWTEHRVRPEHAAMLIQMLSEAMPRVRFRSSTNHSQLGPDMRGAMHFMGAQEVLQDDDVEQRLPGESGVWYHLDPAFGVQAYATWERAYQMEGRFLPNEVFPRELAPEQGFVTREPQGAQKVQELGLVEVLSAVRESVVAGVRRSGRWRILPSAFEGAEGYRRGYRRDDMVAAPRCGGALDAGACLQHDRNSWLLCGTSGE